MSSLVTSITSSSSPSTGEQVSTGLIRSTPACETADEVSLAASLMGDDQERSQRIWAALRELHEGAQLAQNLGRELWDFAVEIDQLQRHGLRANDLRWLIFKGLVCHGHETTARSAEGRCFTGGGPSRFDRRSCFVLTQTGTALLGRHRTPADSRLQGTATGLEPLVPTWDQQRQELRLAQYLIKRFKVPARTQCVILSTFEEENWPARIDDPLSGHPELDRKRRLHNAINALNRNQIHPLVHFLGDGRGQGVRWEFQPDSPRRLKLG
jgi:hypothetical protein